MYNVFTQVKYVMILFDTCTQPSPSVHPMFGEGGQAGWDKIPTLTENHLWLLPLHSLLHLFSQYCCLRFPAILALFPPHPTYFCTLFNVHLAITYSKRAYNLVSTASNIFCNISLTVHCAIVTYNFVSPASNIFLQYSCNILLTVHFLQFCTIFFDNLQSCFPRIQDIFAVFCSLYTLLGLHTLEIFCSLYVSKDANVCTLWSR